jgi:hypothetical protein
MDLKKSRFASIFEDSMHIRLIVNRFCKSSNFRYILLKYLSAIKVNITNI